MKFIAIRMCIVICVLLLSSSLGMATHLEAYSTQPLNDTGVLFTEINITEIQQLTNIVKQAEVNLLRLCNTYNTTVIPCTNQKPILHSLIQTIDRRTGIITELVNPRRIARSLFDGVGKGLHYLFGTVDSENEQIIYSKISELEKDNKALMDLEKHQISVVKSTFQELHKPLKEIELHQRETTKTVNELLSFVKDDLASRQQVQEVVMTLSLQILEMEFRQRTLIDILTAIKNNQLHPLLIPPSAIEKVYKKINPDKYSWKDFPNFTEMVEVKTQFLNGVVVVRIILPIFSLNPFSLQQIYVFPTHLDSKHPLMLNIDYHYIASNIRTQEFVLLKRNDLQHYKKHNNNLNKTVYVGPLLNPIVKGDVSQECPINFLYNPFSEPVHCKYLALANSQPILVKLNRKNTWLYSLPSPIKIQITCKSEKYHSKLENTGLLILNEPCHFQIENQVIYFEDDDHTEIKITQPTYHTVQSYSFSESARAILNKLPKPINTSSILLLKGQDIGQTLRQSTLSLEELEIQLKEIESKDKEKFKAQAIQFTSLSLSSISIIIIFILVCALITIKRKRKAPQISERPQIKVEISPPILPENFPQIPEKSNINHKSTEQIDMLESKPRINTLRSKTKNLQVVN